ncbi:hypothetical protein ACGFYU_04945 [Streptomyces sp. NPDC048337]|uniref:hypothetical protein n=1 Tax=Streptomyces sp. NPDC048337 TaxID=3365535 RepID=UPI003717A665
MATVAAQRAEIGTRLTLIGLGIQLAARLGISPAEAAELAGYWVRKGRLKREEIGAPERDGCFFASRGCASSCPDGPSRQVLIALSPVRERRR